MRFYPLIYRLHKILAVLVGIQLLLWVSSGVYMTAVPLPYVHGDHLRDKAPLASIPPENLPEVVRRYTEQNTIEPIRQIILFQRDGDMVYQLKGNDKTVVIDATTGTLVPDVTEQRAIEIAQASYTGDAEVSSALAITSYESTPEIKGRDLPIWQVNFSDWANTSLYVSNIEARVITARSDIWRVFDFLWMLHIMDYDERDDFNNPLVILMATLGLFFVLSGVILVIKGFQRSGTKFIK